MNVKNLIATLVLAVCAGCSGHSAEENAVYEKLLDASIMAQANNHAAFYQHFSDAQLLYGRLKQGKNMTKRNEGHLDLAMTHAVILNIIWESAVKDESARENADCLARELALYNDPRETAPAGSCKTETIKQ
jgi:hypothetical protein